MRKIRCFKLSDEEYERTKEWIYTTFPRKRGRPRKSN